MTRTTGQRTAREGLLGRKITLPLADLHNKGDDFRKFTLRVDDVQGVQCLTSFSGMSTTSDKLRALVRKRQTLINVFHDIKTTDGYVLRVFVVGSTRRQRGQRRLTSYAQRSHIVRLRRRIVKIIQDELSTCDIPTLTLKLSSEVIGRQVEKASLSIYPLQNVLTYKVKVIRAPRGDLGRLLELHGGSDAIRDFETAAALQATAATGAAVERPEEEVEEIVAE